MEKQKNIFDDLFIYINRYLDLYRRWIAERIDAADTNIEYIDATEARGILMVPR